jgi:hypothetical protein
LRGYSLAGIVIGLGAVSISIIWQLLTGDYPTHSDVFWIGVQTGVLGMLFVISVSLICYYSYRLILFRKRK